MIRAKKIKPLKRWLPLTYISICDELSNCFLQQGGNMDHIITIAKALSDPNRVRALMMLHEGELCACQIIDVLGLAPSTVSKHMSVLRQAGLVRGRKQGKWMYYSLVTKEKQVREIIDWVNRSLCTATVVLNDRKKLKTNICRTGE